MAMTDKQRAAIAVIVLVGVLATAAALWGGRGSTAPDPHDEVTAHAADRGHDDDHGAGGTGSAAAPDRAGGRGGDHAAQAHGQTPGAAGRGQHDEVDDHAMKQIHLSPTQIKAAGIEVQTIGAGLLQNATAFQGELRFNEDRTAHVVPRLSGVVERVPAVLGQRVRKNEVLAVISSAALSEQRSELLAAQRRLESAKATYEREHKLWRDRIAAEQDVQLARSAWQEAEIAVDNARQKLSAVGASPAAGPAAAVAASLNRFEVRAPFDGTVVDKHIAQGEAVKEDTSIFTLSDLGIVWAEFNVAPKDLETVRVGQRVVVTSSASERRVEGVVSYVGALLGEQTRTAKARVTLTNPQGAWRPGLFVTVAVLGEAQPVPLAVPAEAVQTEGQASVVFRATPEGFEPVPVRLGRSDGRHSEVLAGLKLGDRIAVANAFVLKSELGKGAAGHEH